MSSSVEWEAALETLRAENRELRRVNDLQQRLLRAIVDHAPAVMYAKDLSGRFLLSNRLHAGLLGIEPDDLVGKSEVELIGPEAAADIEAVVERVVGTGEPVAAEFAIPLAGEKRVFLEHVFPLRGEDDRVEGVGGVAIDITERKRAEDTVRVFVSLAEHSPDGILVKPADGGVALINQALRRILGLAADATADEAAGLLAGPTGGREFLRRDGVDVSLELTRFVIPGADGEPAATATLVRDVTELRRASREREQQAETIRRQQEQLIAELSAPLLPLAPGVLLLPLIGSLDEARSLQVQEAALEAIAQLRTRVLILDLTGLRTVGDAPADRLIGLVQVVRLVGARVVLTGIRPEIASALADLGFTPRSGLAVMGTLADAVRGTLAAGGR